MNRFYATINLLSNLWRYISKKRKRQIILNVFFVTITAFLEMLNIGAVLPFFAVLISPERIFRQNWLQPIIQVFHFTNPKQLLLPFVILFSLIIFISGIMRLIILRINTRLAYAIGSDLGNEIYHKTLIQPYTTHVNRNSSDIIDGIANKVNQVINSVLLPTFTIFSVLFILISILIVLAFVNYLVILSTFFCISVIYGSVIFFIRDRLWENSRIISSESTKIIKILQESLGGIRDILIDNSQKTYISMYRRADFQIRKAQSNTAFIGNSPRYAVETISTILIVVIAYLFVQNNDDVTYIMSMLAIIVIGAQRLLPLIQQTYGAWSSILGNSSTIQVVIKLLEQPKSHFIEKKFLVPIKFQKNIYLKQISFRYNNNSTWILKNINLNITKGSRIGFIGATGSGKSTLIDIIMGLLPPSNGLLIIDNVPITTKNYQSWQSIIAHVPQDIFLSDNTIEENIAFGVPKNKINHGEVVFAAQQAQLIELIEGLPEKYNTIIGERGIRLSGGQKQRLGIARALYKKASIIIFDEATSALDNHTENKIMQTIESLDKDLTILIVAHRITTLKGCSKIVELNNNEIKRIVTYSQIIKCMET